MLNVFYIVLWGIWLVVAVKYTRVAVLLLSLFFPSYLIGINIGGIPVYFIEGLIFVTAIPVFVNILKGKDIYLLNQKTFSKILHIFKNLFKPKNKPILEFIKSPFLPVSLFLIACLFSAYIVPVDYAKQALGILKSWIIVPLIYFVLLHYTVKNTKDISMVLYSYLASSVFLCLWGLFQAVSGQYITIDQRVSGPFASANYLAMFISPVFIFCAIGFLRSLLHEKFDTADIKWNKFENRIYLGIIIALLFAVLVLTQSYGGIVGVFIALFTYIIYERIKAKEINNRKFLNKFIFFILMIFVLGGGFAIGLNHEKFTNLTKLNERTSLSTRLEIWIVGYELIKESPVLGIGLGQYENLYKQNAEKILQKKPYEEVRLHSHNLYMEFWLNSGIFGFVSFIWITILAFLQIRKNLSPEEKKLLISLLIMLTYILVHGLIDVPFWKNDLALIFWMIYAGIFALGKDKKA